MPRPNLLFIMCDQLRYDCLGYTGLRDVRTPNLDALARSGVWFDKAYTPIPVCAPARQSLFAGRRPETFGALWNFDIVFPVGQIPAGEWSWTGEVAARGYSTGFLGKWNVSNTRPPSDFGFERYVSDSEIMRGINAQYPGQSYPSGFFGDPCPVPLEESHTHKLAKAAGNLIGEFTQRDKPWYIHLDFQEPHLPCRPSAPYDTMYNPADIHEWGGFHDSFEGKPYIHRQQVVNWELENKPWSEWARTVALYQGIISQMDDAIGRVLEALRQSGQADNTLVVFTCDHGDLCGSHNMIDKHYVMYEDLVHIPLILSGGGISPGRFSGYVHNTLDIVPTLLEMMDIPYKPDVLQGESLLPALEGKTQWGRDYAVSTYNGQQFGLFCARSITSGAWKYVWNLTDIDELYNLESDPYELKNLIYDKNHSETLGELRRLLHAELSRCGDKIVGWTSAQLLHGRKL